MSSNISTVYNALVTRIVAVFPNHVRLANAYKIEENTEPALKLGWALQVGGGQRDPRSLSCKMAIKRDFLVTLTRKVYAQEMDASARASADLSLLEDQFLLIEDVEGEPTLGSSGIVAKSGFVSDTGIEFVHAGKDNFIKLTSSFELMYFEDLN